MFVIGTIEIFSVDTKADDFSVTKVLLVCYNFFLVPETNRRVMFSVCC